MIETWLQTFITAWKDYDIETALSGLAEDVEYFETPHQLLLTLSDIEREWQVILEQKNIEIDYEIIASEGATSTVRWKLNYTKNEKPHDVRGVWIITLDDIGKCIKFYQVCESQ